MIDETELLEDLRHIRSRPKMWMRRGTFNDTCALIHGMDLGTDGQLLAGFRDWLGKRLGTPHEELPWWDLSLMLTFPEERFSSPVAPIPDDEKARTELINQIEAFLMNRENTNETRIFN